MADTTQSGEHHYTFHVKMTCGGCSGAVERVLKKTEGGFSLPKFSLFQSPALPPPSFIWCAPLKCSHLNNRPQLIQRLTRITNRRRLHFRRRIRDFAGEDQENGQDGGGRGEGWREVGSLDDRMEGIDGGHKLEVMIEESDFGAKGAIGTRNEMHHEITGR